MNVIIWILRILKLTFSKFVKICEFYELLKFVKFKFSIYGLAKANHLSIARQCWLAGRATATAHSHSEWLGNCTESHSIITISVIFSATTRWRSKLYTSIPHINQLNRMIWHLMNWSKSTGKQPSKRQKMEQKERKEGRKNQRMKEISSKTSNNNNTYA